MASAAKSKIVSGAGRQRFLDQFGKDLKFFQLFFLLINKSCAIKKIDLVWAEHGPAGRVGLGGVLGTADALQSSCASLLNAGESPDPSFCNLVNDFGRREAESCGISDRGAQKRVRVLGKAQVYRCHAGLIDIAVPVMCDGQHIATLLTGQVLREPPSKSGLVQIQEEVARLKYIDQEKLEKAYWQVPVVSQEEIDNAIGVLQIFAEYLATSWKRLCEAVESEQRKARELQLCRKEFAHAVLEKQLDPAAIHELIERLGFTVLPNRVLVVRLESEEEYYSRSGAFDVAFTSALQAIESVCEQIDNISWAYLRKRGVIVFFFDPSGTSPRVSEFQAQRLAQGLLHAMQERSDLRARIGIGQTKDGTDGLLDSYGEACMALAASGDTIARFHKPSAAINALAKALENISSLIAERRFHTAKAATLGLPPLAGDHLGEKLENLPAQRHFFSCALDSMLFEAQKLGCVERTLDPLRAESHRSLDRAAGIFELQQAFLESADRVLHEARQLFAGKREKIVEQTCRIIEQQLQRSQSAQAVSLSGIASTLGVSAGHLSRTFRQTVGLTFERYLMVRRVEFAKRLLLDPSNRIVIVSDRCGFSDPTYFARVFRQIAGCSPSEYAKEPLRFT